jgi:hypothetical protein
MIPRETIFSPCRKWRYTLWREWWRTENRPLCRDCADSKVHGICDDDGRRCDPNDFVQFIGLNPSTADETKDDPTIRRCINFAKAWGFRSMCMTNLFAWRDTDPKAMKAVPYPVGGPLPPSAVIGSVIDYNTIYLLETMREATLVVAAWGTHGPHMDRQSRFMATVKEHGLFDKLQCLGRNDDGTPKHPLYLSKALKPVPFTQ